MIEYKMEGSVMKRAIITVLGKDKVGIIAKTAFISRRRKLTFSRYHRRCRRF